MAIWSAEIKELEKLCESFKGQLPDMEKELERLIKADDENMILLYSRRCLEVIITDLCECELKRPRKTEPLKGIIDKLNKEGKVPSYIIASMHSLNSLSTFGTHPKEFDPEQLKPVLNNLNIIIKWYLKYKDLQIVDRQTSEEEEYEIKNTVVSPSEKSIIVLPFENMSPDPDQEYFSDGLTEEIITDLSHIHDLLVISRSSAMTFKGTKKKIGEIASDVKVRYVLEGSVRKAGNNLRITAQLIDAMSDTHLWAEKYSGILDDIFDIQEKVSRSIVSALRLKLTANQDRKIANRPIDNFQAYDLYLRARNAYFKFNKEGLDEAARLLESGHNIIGDNALLLATLGWIYEEYVRLGLKHETFLVKAEECAHKALFLYQDTTLAYIVLAMVHYLRGDIKGSVYSFKKALLLDPNNIETIQWIPLSYILIGRTEEALPIANRILEIDPLNPVKYILGIVYFYLGLFEQAVEVFSTLVHQFPWTRWWFAYFLVYVNRTEEAINIIDSIEKTPAFDYGFYFAHFIKHTIHKDSCHVPELLTDEFVTVVKRDALGSCTVATFYAMLNDMENSLNWLENSVNRGFINYPYICHFDPFLAKLRGDSRFKKLLERVKHEWENFEG
jgi:TolB-like protein